MLIRCRRLIKLVILGILVARMSYYNINVGCTETNNKTSNGSGGAAAGAAATPTSGNGSNKQGVELDIKGKAGTDQYDYLEILFDNTNNYTAKGNNGFNKVKCGSKEIWKTEDTKEYARRVVFNNSDKSLTIELGNDTTKKYKKDVNDKWTEIGSSGSSQQTGSSAQKTNGSQQSTPTKPSTVSQPSSRTAIELDINSKKTTDQWSYTNYSNNKFNTYEAKEGYRFNKVLEKKTIGSNQDIWSTTDSKEYASKVEYDENAKTVTITLSNGGTKKFKKSGGLGSKSWSEVTQSQQSRL